MDDSVQKVKDRLNITEVVGGYVQLQKAGRNYRARCPFHKERTPSFMISPERGSYMCFGCGEKGDIFSFVQKMDGIDFGTALKQLAERAGVDLPKFAVRTPEQKEKTERLYDVCEDATQFFEGVFSKRDDVQEYVKSRGVKDETVQQWRIGYAPASWRVLSEHLLLKGHSKEEIIEAGLGAPGKEGVYDRFRGRIMFPIFDIGGKVVAFSGRFFEKIENSREEGEPAKYVNSPETALFKKSRILYGLDRAKEAIRKTDCILLVEGQFDMVLSHQSGLPIACAVSGTALTPEHLALLSRFSKRLVLALDNDEAGLRSGLKSSAMAIAAGFDVKIPKILGGKDPADLAAKDPELLKNAVRGSLPAIEFFLDALKPMARDDRAYKKLVEVQVLPLAAAIPSKIDQAHFIRVIADRLRVPEEAVRAEVAKKPQLTESDSFVAERIGTTAPAQEMSDAPTLEKAAALVLFHFDAESAQAARLAEILGEERRNALLQKYNVEAERLRFEFDLLGDNETSVGESLLRTAAHGVIDEKIAMAKEALRSASEAGDNTEELKYTKELTALMRERQTMHR